MKFKIEHWSNGFQILMFYKRYYKYIQTRDIDCIAQELSMETEDFINILLYNRASAYNRAYQKSPDYYFKRRRDAKKCIEACEPYIIMAKLME